MPVTTINREFNDELVEQCKANKGEIALRLHLYDELHSNTVMLDSKAYRVKINKDFYRWLEQKQQQELLSYSW